MKGCKLFFYLLERTLSDYDTILVRYKVGYGRSCQLYFALLKLFFPAFHPVIMHINKSQFFNFKPLVMTTLGRGSDVKSIYLGRVALFVSDMLIYIGEQFYICIEELAPIRYSFFNKNRKDHLIQNEWSMQINNPCG